MATDTHEAAAPAAHGDPAAHAAAGSGKKKLILMIAGVMLLEGAGLFFFLSKGGHPPAATADSHGSHGSHGDSGDHDSHHPSTPEEDIVEVPIDTFTCTNGKAAPGSIIHITFKLYAVVPSAQREAFEKAANSDLRGRLRQAIVKVARSSSMEDLNDAELSTLKRLIREEMNKTLRKNYVTEVVISDFKTVEQ